jgi:hypothetical protein
MAAIGGVRDHVEALASNLAEPLGIPNREDTTPVVDDALVAQRRCRLADGRSRRAHHLGDEFVREFEAIGVRPFRCQEQPPGEPLH